MEGSWHLALRGSALCVCGGFFVCICRSFRWHGRLAFVRCGPRHDDSLGLPQRRTAARDPDRRPRRSLSRTCRVGFPRPFRAIIGWFDSFARRTDYLALRPRVRRRVRRNRARRNRKTATSALTQIESMKSEKMNRKQITVRGPYPYGDVFGTVISGLRFLLFALPRPCKF